MTFSIPLKTYRSGVYHTREARRDDGAMILPLLDFAELQGNDFRTPEDPASS
jgi:hypothetical protein